MSFGPFRAFTCVMRGDALIQGLSDSNIERVRWCSQNLDNVHLNTSTRIKSNSKARSTHSRSLRTIRLVLLSHECTDQKWLRGSAVMSQA
jgi:hypothetical protein